MPTLICDKADAARAPDTEVAHAGNRQHDDTDHRRRQTYTKRLLAYLAAHDEWLGSRHEYTVVHSVLAVPHCTAALVGADEVRNFYEEDAELVFRPIRAFFEQHGIKAHFVHTVGHAAESIAKLAAEGRFDLIVMGSRDHGDLANLELGSVATQVIARTTIPVLLVR